jgi:hypothetical protein
VSTLTSVIELAVGLACFAGAVAAWPRGLRWVSALLAIAGATAVVHALVSLGWEV